MPKLSKRLQKMQRELENIEIFFVVASRSSPETLQQFVAEAEQMEYHSGSDKPKEDKPSTSHGASR